MSIGKFYNSFIVTFLRIVWYIGLQFFKRFVNTTAVWRWLQFHMNRSLCHLPQCTEMFISEYQNYFMRFRDVLIHTNSHRI